MSGIDPANKLFPKSRYFKFVQFFKSSVIIPCNKLDPKESFSNDGSWHIESNGSDPDSFCFESSISRTSPASLQVTPVKVHGELAVESHVEKSWAFESWSEDLSFNRI